jgi:hypothetical protein
MREPNKSESLSTAWKVHIQDWQTTEQSQSVYCKSHDLNYHASSIGDASLLARLNQRQSQSSHQPLFLFSLVRR